MDYFNRKRNFQEATGEPYSQAFTQTEILERGWTISMVRRHIGPPNEIFSYPKTYHFDRRRIYAAEATPAVQFDLLATEDVRLIGPHWLRQYAAYIPNILRASLLTRAERTEDESEAEFCRNLADKLPPARDRAETSEILRYARALPGETAAIRSRAAQQLNAAVKAVQAPPPPPPPAPYSILVK